MGIKKILGIALTAVGAVGTIIGTTLLPVGCLKAYKMTVEQDGVKMTLSQGVGASNYGELALIEVEQYPAGTTDEMKKQYEKIISDSINKFNKKLDEEKKNIKDASYSNYVKAMKDSLSLVDNMPSGPAKDELVKSDEYKMAKAVLSASDMRIAGAVLLPIFAVIMIIGIVFVVLSKNKKAKSVE